MAPIVVSGQKRGLVSYDVRIVERTDSRETLDSEFYAKKRSKCKPIFSKKREKNEKKELLLLSVT